VVVKNYRPAASAATMSIVAASVPYRGWTPSIRTSAYEPAQANWRSGPGLHRPVEHWRTARKLKIAVRSRSAVYYLLPSKVSLAWAPGSAPTIRHSRPECPLVSHGFWHCSLTTSVITHTTKVTARKRFRF